MLLYNKGEIIIVDNINKAWITGINSSSKLLNHEMYNVEYLVDRFKEKSIITET